MESNLNNFVKEILIYSEPNIAGEVLRSITFVGEGYGCYSNFNVREDATRWPVMMLADFWHEYLECEVEQAKELSQYGEGHSYQVPGHSEISIAVCWFWDGDGTLVFRITGPDFERIIVNNDCKKDYNWKEAGEYIDVSTRIQEAIDLWSKDNK